MTATTATTAAGTEIDRMVAQPRADRQILPRPGSLWWCSVNISPHAKPGKLVRTMAPLLRRLAVPLVGASLVLLVIVVAFVILDLGGSSGGSSALTAIQIGSTSSAQESQATETRQPVTPTVTGSAHQAHETESRASDQQQVTGGIQGQDGPTGSGYTTRARGTTIVTAEIRVQPGPGYQDGPTTSATIGSPGSTGKVESSTTTSARAQGSASTGGPYGSTSTAGTHGPSATSGSTEGTRSSTPTSPSR